MGIILSLTGPSGAGKSTLAEQLLNLPHVSLVPSNTTRARREDDMPGEYTYYNRNPQALRELHDGGELAWYVGHKENSYATKWVDLYSAMRDEGGIGIMILVPQVLMKLKRSLETMHAEASWVPIFVEQPPRHILETRLSPTRLLEVDAAREKEAGWLQIAQIIVPDIRVIRNDGPLDETVATIRALLP